LKSSRQSLPPPVLHWPLIWNTHSATKSIGASRAHMHSLGARSVMRTTKSSPAQRIGIFRVVMRQ